MLREVVQSLASETHPTSFLSTLEDIKGFITLKPSAVLGFRCNELKNREKSIPPDNIEEEPD